MSLDILHLLNLEFMLPGRETGVPMDSGNMGENWQERFKNILDSRHGPAPRSITPLLVPEPGSSGTHAGAADDPMSLERPGKQVSQ